MDDSNYPVGGGTPQGQGAMANMQAAQARSQNLRQQAQQLSEGSTSKAPQDSEQQSANTENAELSHEASAASQALNAPMTRAKSFLNGSNYAVSGYTEPSKGIGQ